MLQSNFIISKIVEEQAKRVEGMGKVLLIYPPLHVDYGLWDDLKDDERVVLFNLTLKPINGNLLKKIRSLHLSQRINRVITLPFKEIWYDFSIFNKNVKTISKVIVLDLALADSMVLKIVKKCRKKRILPNLFLINTLDSSVRAMKKVKSNMERIEWDHIYSFDKNDTDKYNIHYLSFCYYSLKKLPIINQPQNDLFLISTLSPDREDLYMSLYKTLTDKGCKCDFNFCLYSELTPSVPIGVHLNKKRLPYKDTLFAMLNSRAILEVLRGSQSGPSLRYYEAVCYNKKLLTNNKEIVKFPYYDSRYMRIFSSLSDIDVEWIKKDDDVDYHYKGDFSPKFLIDFILSQ